MDLWPGSAYPLGATFDGEGTNFAVFSEAARRVELCLFDERDVETRVTLPEVEGGVFHGYVPGITPGQRYGYRVYGPYHPWRGHLSDPSKLLLDPYAKAISGEIDWDGPSLFARPGDTDPPDTASAVPRSLVVDPTFDWGDDRHPNTSWQDTVIYEAHVKGTTMLRPEVPEGLRGTYAGLAHPGMISHLKYLGVTAVELLPVHQFVHEKRLVDLGLRNYWGYSPIGYFAPHGAYAHAGDGGGQVREFKEMVKALHAAGIEVILDVVYNHTGEGDHVGPTICFRGFDNAAYYRLAYDPSLYADFTGCGNTLDARHPPVLQLIVDSLRYWVTEMHVDGFRFDLASALVRGTDHVEHDAPFLAILQQDPVLRNVKLIAEPWDIREGGYMVGAFPGHWSEWNGKYRDVTRAFWGGREQVLGEFASRFTGSSDIYGGSRRGPRASVNFVTCHDGFTLRDLVTYDRKHNDANGEEGRDGDDHNRSWNCGVEGETDDPKINALRRRQRRNFLATLFLSQGVPMLLAGDEMGRTQGGNNNAYCQDNEVSWIDWSSTDVEMLEYTRRLIELRRDHPVLTRRRWFDGHTVGDTNQHDIDWFDPSGRRMNGEDWGTSPTKSLGVYLNGDGIPSLSAKGEPVRSDSFFVVFHAAETELEYTFPLQTGDAPWRLILDTTVGFVEGGAEVVSGDKLTVAPRSLVLLHRPR